MRFVEFGQLAFNQIAVVPQLANPTWYQCASLLFALNDDSCVLFTSLTTTGNPPYYTTLYVYVVDVSGTLTYYASAPMEAQTFINNIVPLGPGLFLLVMNNNTTFFVRVANAKLNNATPIMLKPSPSPLTNPCYGANPKIFYDAAKNLLGVGFYSGGGGGAPTSVWTSIYRPSSSQLTLLSTGFVGTSEGDPFVRAGIVSNPNLYREGTCSNGASYLLNQVSNVDNALVLDYVSYDIAQGVQSDCGTPCGASVSTYSSASVNCSIGANIYYANKSTGGDSNIPGIVGACTYQNPGLPNTNCMFYTDGLSAFQCEFPYAAPDYYEIQNAALTKKYLFASCRTDVPNGSTAILIAPNPGIVRTPTGQLQSAFVTVNSARPISLTGAYRS